MTGERPAPRVDFLLAGTQKGGTSSLNLCLRQHPDIVMCDVKEPHFFDTDSHFEAEPDYGTYHAQFPAARPGQVTGEATPDYLYWPPAIERIRSYNPAMRFVVLLRHPADRAFSQWSMLRGWKHETRPFLQAIRDDVAKLTRGEPFARDEPAYVPRGFYAQQLGRLLKLFPREQLLMLKSERFRDDANPGFTQVCDFLGIRRARLGSQPSLYEGKYARAMHPTERAYLLQVFRLDSEATQRLLGWDCADWFA
jgi:hypothetical protein